MASGAELAHDMLTSASITAQDSLSECLTDDHGKATAGE
jgi:hypothetical protein